MAGSFGGTIHLSERTEQNEQPGGGHDRLHAHGTMKTYNVDAEDDYEFHRNGPGGPEYRGSGHGAYRGYGDNGGGVNSSSSSSRGGGYGGSGGHGSLARGGGGHHGGGYGGGGGGSNHAQNGGGYMHHGDRGGGGGSHYGKSSPPGSDKPPQAGDARYGAAQAAVAAALSHTSISGSSAMSAAAHASASHGNYAVYGNNRGAPSLGPGGGPARYNPSNGDSSGGGGFQGGGGMRGDSGSTSQPRPLARSGGVASHEYSRGGGGTRPAAHSPVSTVLGGGYHNYAVPPGTGPLGGSGGGGGGDPQPHHQHYVSRSVPMSRGEDSRDRDGHGGRGGKRGRW